MEKIKCSVPLLTLNSAENLAECLESLKDFEDVYIVDGNSTDGTQDIAKRYGRIVYKQVDTDEPNVRIKDFAAMRIKAIGFARCDWIFDFDSDEYMKKDLIDEIRQTIANSPGFDKAYNIQKKNVVGKKVVEYSFAYPSYYLRLYNKKSGISFSKAKSLHEEMYVPEGIKIFNLKNSIYSYGPAAYQEIIKKDNHYLEIVRTKIFASGPRRTSRYIDIKAAAINFLRAINFIFKGLGVYARHGFAKSVPPLEVWRYVRYHLIISGYRLKNTFL